MGIRTIIAVGFTLVVVNAQAATNSWIFGGSDFWDTGVRWSLRNAPSITDAADFITNSTSKTITIDDTDSAGFPQELTISNLTVSSPTVTLTNTLSLFDMNDGGPVPLNVLNTLTIGARGLLEITNSMLEAGNASIATNATLLFSLGTNSTAVAIGNNLTLGGKLNVTDAGGFFTSGSYTLFTYGGVLTYNGLTIGTTPSNTNCTIDTSTAGLVKLTVSGFAPPPTGLFKIVSITRSVNDIVIKWTAASAGTNVVQAENGNYNTNNFADISGSIVVSSGVTNSFTDTGGATDAPSRFYRVRTQ